MDATGKSLHFEGKRVKVKMQIMKEHWGNDRIYLCYPWIIKNANMLCSVLTLQVLGMRRDPKRAHKDHLIFQADGGSENWNRTVLLMAAYWIVMGVCK